MYNLYNTIKTYTAGTYQISNTSSLSGSLYWNTAAGAIMTATATGTASFVDGGSVALADLIAKTIYPFRIAWLKVDSGTVYLLY